MPYFNLDPIRFYYEDRGQGSPLVFIHGVWMSGRFFRKQASYFKKSYRVIIPDLRAHGRSTQVHFGHTVANYAQDIYGLIQGLQLKDIVFIGWSMGAFIVWDYLKQFGEENIRATVIVDESPSDFKWPDWPFGSIDFSTLCHIMNDLQMDRTSLLHWLIGEMFANPLAEKDEEWIFSEMARLPESIASAIFFDQSVKDYRTMLSKVHVPTLLCYGIGDKLVPAAAGEHVKEVLANASLVLFENSGHCPFLEEADLFNAVVDEFIQSL